MQEMPQTLSLCVTTAQAVRKPSVPYRVQNNPWGNPFPSFQEPLWYLGATVNPNLSIFVLPNHTELLVKTGLSTFLAGT